MAANAIASKQCHPARKLSLLLLCPISGRGPFFFDLNKETILRLRSRLYSRSQFVLGPIETWLIIIEDTTSDINYSLFFFNPVSRVKVMLPSYSASSSISTLPIPKMVASSASSNNCQDDSIIVAGLLDGYPCIIFCRMTDMSLSMIEAEDGEKKFKDIQINSRDKLLYVLTNERADSIEIYDLQDLDNAPKAKKLITLSHSKTLRGRVYKIESNIRYVAGVEKTYLAHDTISGDLLLVLRYFNYATNVYNHSEIAVLPRTTAFKVWKLNGSSSNNGLQWAKVENLGDLLMFLSRRGCKLISSVGLEDVERNCIYFANINCKSNSSPWELETCRFSFSDGRTHYFDVAGSDESIVLWFTPNLF